MLQIFIEYVGYMVLHIYIYIYFAIIGSCSLKKGTMIKYSLHKRLRKLIQLNKIFYLALVYQIVIKKSNVINIVNS